MPLFSAREDFKQVLKKMGLQARGTAGVDSVSNNGTFDISNADRLGKSETQLVWFLNLYSSRIKSRFKINSTVNIFIEGVDFDSVLV